MRRRALRFWSPRAHVCAARQVKRDGKPCLEYVVLRRALHHNWIQPILKCHLTKTIYTQLQEPIDKYRKSTVQPWYNFDSIANRARGGPLTFRGEGGGLKAMKTAAAPGTPPPRGLVARPCLVCSATTEIRGRHASARRGCRMCNDWDPVRVVPGFNEFILILLKIH